MATIAEIAALAGVSPATVSRVMRNATNVSSITREKVFSAANQLGRPVPAQTHPIKLLAIGPIHISTQPIFDQLAAAAGKYGVSLLCKLVQNDIYLADSLEINDGFDGIFLVDGAMQPSELHKLQARLPVVQCRTYSGLSSDVAVLVDDMQMGYDLTRHLLDSGCRKIAYIREPKRYCTRPFSRDRLRGAMAAMAEAGLSFACICDSETHPETNLLLQAAQNGMDAVILGMCYSQLGAAIDELRRANIAIPAQLSIATYDNDTVSSTLGLTAIRQPFDAIANTAMLLLLDLIEHRASFTETTLVRVAHQLIPRNSTRPVPPQDPQP